MIGLIVDCASRSVHIQETAVRSMSIAELKIWRSDGLREGSQKITRRNA